MIIVFNFGGYSNHVVCAEDYEEEHGENEYYEGEYEEDEEDEILEEVGELLGWGAAIAIVTAGLLFPVRRSAKVVLQKVPNAKKIFIAFSKFLGKNHVLIGIFALVLVITHGVSMLVNEWEFEFEALTGIGTFSFMLIAAMFGIFLINNKKAKRMRNIHITLLVFALLIGVVHIFLS